MHYLNSHLIISFNFLLSLFFGLLISLPLVKSLFLLSDFPYFSIDLCDFILENLHLQSLVLSIF